MPLGYCAPSSSLFIDVLFPVLIHPKVGPGSPTALIGVLQTLKKQRFLNRFQTYFAFSQSDCILEQIMPVLWFSGHSFRAQRQRSVHWNWSSKVQSPSQNLDSSMVSSLLMMKLILVDSSILVLAVAISPEQSSGLASGVLDSKVRHRTFADWRHPMSFGCFLQMDFQTEGLQMNTRKMKNPRSMLRTPMMLKITLEW